jgi:hypothetical protein
VFKISLEFLPQKYKSFFVTTISWLLPFMEIDIFSKDSMKPINTFHWPNAEPLVGEAGDTYSYHRALKL